MAAPIAGSTASGETQLLDLPERCLHHIVRCMDQPTRQQFFKASRGGLHQAGCALAVLKASCKTKLVFRHGDDAMPAGSPLLHWAGQNGNGIEVAVYCRMNSLSDVLRSLLRFQQEPAPTDTPEQVLGSPAVYPGITKLTLRGCKSDSLIPETLAAAFPNLKELSVLQWRLQDGSCQTGAVLRQGVSCIQHATVFFPLCQPHTAAAIAHISEQLSYLPALTSLDVEDRVFEAQPKSVLARLHQVRVQSHRPPTVALKAAIAACSQLNSLTLRGDHLMGWLRILPACASSTLQLLHAPVHLDGDRMRQLLDLPQLTSLSVSTDECVTDDYSDVPCNWRRLEFTHSCTSSITKLPLHALDSPVTCPVFRLQLSTDHAVEMIAIRAAKSHLLRCGGISMRDAKLWLEVPSVRLPITRQDMSELLEEWAPCLSAPRKIFCVEFDKEIVQDVVAKLWPMAQFAVTYE